MTTDTPAEESQDETEVIEDELVEVEGPEVTDPHELGLDLPEDADEASQLLLSEVKTAREEAGSYLDDLQRVAADFDNYRKRVQREMAHNVERASQRVVQNLLPVLDSFDLALSHETETPSEEKLLGGVRGTHAQLLDVLAKEGLEVIPSVGVEFDPELHEAVLNEAAGDGPLMVVAEMRRGYTLRGRVIRPTMVTVGD